MTKRRDYPAAVVRASASMADEELPVLLDHLDAYVAGIDAVREATFLKSAREASMNLVAREAHEAIRQVQAELRRRGWTLQPDGRKWLPPGFSIQA